MTSNNKMTKCSGTPQQCDKIDNGKKPCEKQLSSAGKEYLRNTLGELMPTVTVAGVAGVGAHAAPGALTTRKICEKVLKWQAAQGCHRIPNPRSLDLYEKSLGKSFQDVVRRRYGAIGKRPCQRQLSADEIHFINGIPGVPPRGCSVNAASPVSILHQQEQQVSAQESVKRRRLRADMQDGASPARAPCEASVTAADPNAELAKQRLTRARTLFWDAMFEAVRKWVRTHQGKGKGMNVRYPSQKSKDKDEKRLAFWVNNQRQEFHGKRGLRKLKGSRRENGSRREMLESLPGWTWGQKAKKKLNVKGVVAIKKGTPLYEAAKIIYSV